MAFTSSTSPRTSNFLRKVIITAKSTYSNNRANLRPQPTPVQDWYLDKLRQNIECELSLGAKGVQTSSNSSSISSKYGSSTSFTKSDSIVTPSNVQSGSGTEILVEESHHRSWNTGRKLKTKKSVRLNVPAGFEKARGATAMIQSITETGMPVHAAASVKDDIPAPDVRIEDLCSILTICDGNDSWLGYLSGEEHLRHELRSIQAGSIPAEAYELISLENLLAHGNRSKLTRKQGYRLAVILASSMLQLQTTPWLTDQLAKKNIFFYQNGSDILADQPYIRHSFSSNISSPKATPEQKPTQPTQPAPPFAIRNTTRNSLVHLGILLLELCFGQPIEEQTDLRNQYLMDGKAHNDTDFLTARDWVYAVGEEAGEEFEKAVKCCVQCNFDGKLDWSDIQFTQSVYVAVVEPLEKAYISANFV